MKTQPTNLINPTKSVVRVVALTAAVLSIPLLAMQFSNEVDWSAFDFMIIGTLLLTTGFIYEFVVRRVVDTRRRLIVAAVLFFALFLIWAELAVGVFGSPLAGS